MFSWKEMVWVSFPSAQQLVAGIKLSWQYDWVSVAHRCLADSGGAALEPVIDMWFCSPWQPQAEQPNSQKHKIETHPLTRPATVELWKRPWKQRRKQIRHLRAILRMCKAMVDRVNTNQRYCRYFCLDAGEDFVLCLLRPRFSLYVTVC